MANKKYKDASLLRGGQSQSGTDGVEFKCVVP